LIKLCENFNKTLFVVLPSTKSTADFQPEHFNIEIMKRLFCLFLWAIMPLWLIAQYCLIPHSTRIDPPCGKEHRFRYYYLMKINHVTNTINQLIHSQGQQAKRRRGFTGKPAGVSVKGGGLLYEYK